MKLEDVVHSLNEYIDSIRLNNGIQKDGYIAVLRQTTTPSSFTKAIKAFEIRLIYVYKRGSKQYTLFSETITDKITTDPQELKLLSTLEQRIIRDIMFLLQDKEQFDKILNNDF